MNISGLYALFMETLKTTQAMYTRYERGANEMPIRHLVTLCKFYNVSADYLLDTAPDPKRRQKSLLQNKSTRTDFVSVLVFLHVVNR